MSVGIDRIEDLDEALPDTIERADLPWEAVFLAGRCFLHYRAQRRRSSLTVAGLYIAAHERARAVDT